MRIILASSNEHKIGDNIVNKGVSDGNRIVHTISYKIIRVATIDEYLEWCKETNAILPDWPWHWVYKYFYEIQTD